MSRTTPSRGAHRRRRRRNGSGRPQTQPGGPVTTRWLGAIGNVDGVPIYDGTVIVDVTGPTGDRRLALGVGPAGEDPRGYVLLCPTEGVRGLISDLQAAAAVVAEHHPHDGTCSGSWPAP